MWGTLASAWRVLSIITTELSFASLRVDLIISPALEEEPRLSNSTEKIKKIYINTETKKKNSERKNEPEANRINKAQQTKRKMIKRDNAKVIQKER